MCLRLKDHGRDKLTFSSTWPATSIIHPPRNESTLGRIMFAVAGPSSLSLDTDRSHWTSPPEDQTRLVGIIYGPSDKTPTCEKLQATAVPHTRVKQQRTSRK